MTGDLALYLLALVGALFGGRLFSNGLGLATGGLGRWVAARSGKEAPAPQTGPVSKLGTLFPASLTTTAGMLSVAVAEPPDSPGRQLALPVAVGGAALVTTVLLPLVGVIRTREGRGGRRRAATGHEELTEAERRGPLGDVLFFLAAFAAALLAGVLDLPRAGDAVVAVLVLVAFALRVRRRLPTLPTAPTEEHQLFLPGRVVSGWLGLGQAFLGLVVVGGAAELALQSLEDLSSRSGRSVAVVGLLLIPAFGELLGKDVTLRRVLRGEEVAGIAVTTSSLAFGAGAVVPVLMILGVWDTGSAVVTAGVVALAGAAVVALAFARRGPEPGRAVVPALLLAAGLVVLLLSGALR